MVDDRQLVAALLGKDRDSALAECVRRYGQMVKRSAWRITGDEHLAEDVCQAVFLVLVRKAGSLINVKFLGAWLYRVAVTAARDVAKSQARRQKREQESLMVAQAHAKLATTLLRGVDQAVSRLPESYRQVIVAHYFQGQSYAEVSAKLGLPEETVKKRGTRGVRRLRKYLSATVPGLTLTALGSVLAGEAAAASATALPASSVATIQAVAIGTKASAQVASIADATVKAMAWAKLQIWGATAATLVLVGGIAAFLPSKSPAWQSETLITSQSLAVAFSADGRYCATTSGSSVSLWDMNSGRKLADFPGPNEIPNSVYHVLAFSPDGKILAAAGTTRKIVQFWETDGGRPLKNLNDTVPNTVTNLVFSPDGRSLAMADLEGGIHVWDIAAGKELAAFPGDRTAWTVNGLAFSPDGKTLAATAPGGGAVRLWNLATREAVVSLPGAGRGGPVAFSADGRLLAGTSTAGVLKVWDIAAGTERFSLQPPQDKPLFLKAVTFSRDSKLVAAYVYSKELRDCVTIWDVSSGQQQASFPLEGKGLALALAFGNDNRTLSVGSIPGVNRWTAPAGSSR
jgi:RNA polymerase sigma factor (sigma-70 family)